MLTHLTFVIIIFFIMQGSLQQTGTIVADCHYYMATHYKKFHRIAEKNSNGRIGKTDSLMFIPYLAIKKPLKENWDWLHPENNAKFADFQNLIISEKSCDKFLVYSKDNYWHSYYSNGGLQKKFFTKTNNSVARSLLKNVNYRRPDLIFMVTGVPGWFLVFKNDIKHLSKTGNEQLTLSNEDAIEIIEREFISNNFWPHFEEK